MGLFYQPVFYLLVALIRILNPVDDVSVNYFRDAAPAGEFLIELVDSAEGDAHLVFYSPAEDPGSDGDNEGFPLRIEQSDLYSHQYIMNPSGVPPQLIDLTPVNRWLTGSEWEGLDGLAGPLHLIERPPLVILSSESEGILLIAR